FIAVPIIGTDAPITSADQHTGAGGTANMSGSADTTSYADTKRLASRNAAATGSPESESVRCADVSPVHAARFSDACEYTYRDPVPSFKRPVEPSASAPNESALPSRGSPYHSARFCEN